jgi:alpha-1,6-mannosyltransferase
VGFTWAAIHNYPGGRALQTLHLLARDRTQTGQVTTVHIDVPAAMTGVSRFGQLQSPLWHYSKEENLAPAVLRARGFDFLLSANETGWEPDYLVVAQAPGFSRIDLRAWPPRFVMEPKIFIWQRQPSSLIPTTSE